MLQIFIVGSSSAYGVGAETAGWGDLVKQHMHGLMYGSDGVGEKCEVYNFTKSGATIGFVKNTFPEQLKQYGRDVETMVIVSAGGNNSKAEGTPNNFVSTPKEFEEEMRDLLKALKNSSDKVLYVTGGFVDESKTNPKPNPLTGGKSYFSNERRKQFSTITRKLCEELRVTYVGLDVDKDKWIQNYLYVDGLHPNQAGHELIFQNIKPHLPELS